MRDDVNFPAHYTSGDVESIDAIWASGHGVGFCLGNAQKYLFRAGKKGDMIQDLRKAAWYVAFLLSKLDDEARDPREIRKDMEAEREAEDELWATVVRLRVAADGPTYEKLEYLRCEIDDVDYVVSCANTALLTLRDNTWDDREIMGFVEGQDFEVLSVLEVQGREIE